MSISIPGELEWLGWVAGSDWPDGDEDRMWAIAAEWRTAAADLRELLPELAAARSATLEAYPWGAGIEAITARLDELDHGPQSLERLAELLDLVGESADALATEIEYTKILVLTSLAMLAVEIAAAWIFPPTAPLAEAVAIATTRLAVRLLGQRAVSAIAQFAAKTGIAALTKFLAKHVAVSTALGAGQDLAIQAYQVGAGHRDDIDWDRVTTTAYTAAAAGAVGGPVGGLLAKGAAKVPLPGGRWAAAGKGMVVGAGSGMAGALGAWGVGGIENGWTWDPRLLTSGAAYGVLTGGSKGFRHSAFGRGPGAGRFAAAGSARFGDGAAPHPAIRINDPAGSSSPHQHGAAPQPSARITDPVGGSSTHEPGAAPQPAIRITDPAGGSSTRQPGGASESSSPAAQYRESAASGTGSPGARISAEGSPRPLANEIGAHRQESATPARPTTGEDAARPAVAADGGGASPNPQGDNGTGPSHPNTSAPVVAGDTATPARAGASISSVEAGTASTNQARPGEPNIVAGPRETGGPGQGDASPAHAAEPHAESPAASEATATAASEPTGTAANEPTATAAGEPTATTANEPTATAAGEATASTASEAAASASNGTVEQPASRETPAATRAAEPAGPNIATGLHETGGPGQGDALRNPAARPRAEASGERSQDPVVDSVRDTLRQFGVDADGMTPEQLRQAGDTALARAVDGYADQTAALEGAGLRPGEFAVERRALQRRIEEFLALRRALRTDLDQLSTGSPPAAQNPPTAPNPPTASNPPAAPNLPASSNAHTGTESLARPQTATPRPDAQPAPTTEALGDTNPDAPTPSDAPDTTSKIPYTPRYFGVPPIPEYRAAAAPDESVWQPGTTPSPPPEANPEPAPPPEPEPAPQPQPEPEPAPQPQPEPQPWPGPRPEPHPEPTPQPQPQPKPEPHPEPTPQPQPEPAPQPEPEPQPGPGPGPGPKPEPQAWPEPKPEPQP
ncbi:hypothetical protein [Nocardia sp. NPDC048505]|uniref:WXG100-like domain-containing protein n=1 Tax=unclassified Nocardia TaxID=2637762 RepID=UPI00340DDC72